MRLLAFAAFVFALLAAPLHAQEKKDAVVPLAPAPASVSAAQPAAPAPSVNVPDTSNILFMQNLRKIGATIYYLGEALGLHGWFVVKDGQVQILYTTPDQKALLVGALLSAEGANVSQQQVMVLANSNPEIQKIVKNSAAVTGQVTKPSEAKPAEHAAVEPAKQPVPSVDAGASPSERFFAELQKSASFTFGREGTPQLIMIMDVHCPHCHKSWNLMQPLVEAGKLRVTLVPIRALGQQSEIDGGIWLASKDPYDSWKKMAAGDETLFKNALRDTEKERLVLANTDLIRKWGVDQTPYILYHGKNGKVRLIVGEPKGMDDIMKDITN